jgi:hypothetical protein
MEVSKLVSWYLRLDEAKLDDAFLLEGLSQHLQGPQHMHNRKSGVVGYRRGEDAVGEKP